MPRTKTSKYDLSVVVSVFNEEDCLSNFHKTLIANLKKLRLNAEVIYVDDGSEDKSFEILSKLAKASSNTRVVKFSKNFGHEAAMLAGIDRAMGDAIICMDADLQNPPELIKDIMKKYDDSYEVVNMVRSKNSGVNVFSKLGSTFFYKVLSKLSGIPFTEGASDFFMITQKVAEVFRTNYREQARLLRGFVQTVGFKRALIYYEAPSRFAGKSKYALFSLRNNVFLMTISSLVTFSNFPLRFGVFSGMIVALFAIILGVFSLFEWILGNTIPGYTTIIVVLSFLSAFQLIMMGILGEYLGFVLREVKHRPLYIVEKEVNAKTDR